MMVCVGEMTAYCPRARPASLFIIIELIAPEGDQSTYRNATSTTISDYRAGRYSTIGPHNGLPWNRLVRARQNPSLTVNTHASLTLVSASSSPLPASLTFNHLSDAQRSAIKDPNASRIRETSSSHSALRRQSPILHLTAHQ